MSRNTELIQAAAAIPEPLPPEEWDQLVADHLGDTEPHLAGEALWYLAGTIKTAIAALRGLLAAVDRARAADVEERGPVVFGDTYISVTPKRTPRLVDQDRLVDWTLDIDPRGLAELFRLGPDNLRIGALRALARRRWYADNGYETTAELSTEETADLKAYIDLVQTTFVEYEKGDPTLVEKPLSKAPNKAQALGHGDRLPPRRKRTVPSDD